MSEVNPHAENWYAGVLAKALWDIDNELFDLEGMAREAPCERTVFTGGYNEVVRFDASGRLHTSLYVLDTTRMGGLVSDAHPELSIVTQALEPAYRIPQVRLRLDLLGYRMAAEQMKRENVDLAWRFYLSLKHPVVIFRRARWIHGVYFNYRSLRDVPNLARVARILYRYARCEPLSGLAHPEP